MSNTLDFRLKADTIENLKAFSELLKKDVSWVLEQALDEYIVKVQKELLEKNMADENAMTNLDYDEFWDGVDFDEE
jgi:predicted transcriptional regulator